MTSMSATSDATVAAPPPSPGARNPGRPSRVGHLSRSVERRLVEEARLSGPGARDALVDAYRPLIASVARMYRNTPGVDRAELTQEGVVGLLRALDRYDATMGVPFWGYAAWWVRQAMQQLVSEMGRPVVLSDRALRQLALVRDARRRLTQALGLEPSPGDLAAETGLARDQVERLIRVERNVQSLDVAVGEDSEGATYGDFVADPRAEDGFDRVADRLLVPHLAALLAGLSDRERRIIRGRFGLTGPERTLREVAAEVGVSAERVRQIEHSALAKMREVALAGVDRSGETSRDSPGAQALRSHCGSRRASIRRPTG
jgi:RNA polymerase sigma factor (sigma-70 family)